MGVGRQGPPPLQPPSPVDAFFSAAVAAAAAAAAAAAEFAVAAAAAGKKFGWACGRAGGNLSSLFRFHMSVCTAVAAAVRLQLLWLHSQGQHAVLCIVCEGTCDASMHGEYNDQTGYEFPHSRCDSANSRHETK